MSSGVRVTEEVESTYKDLKEKKMYSYLTFRLSTDFKAIELAEKGKPGATFDDLRDALITAADNKEGRYAVFDLISEEEKLKKNQVGNLVFIFWCHDDKVTPKQKMVLASSKKHVGDKLHLTHTIQVNDVNDLNIEYITSEANKLKVKK